MIKKLKSLRKKPKKPLYYKKSKAAKEVEENQELYETEDLPQPKQYKKSPSRVKKSTRYNKKYEYSDYDDEYEGVTDDLPQQNQFKHSPSRMKKRSQYNRESEYTDYDDEYGGKQYNYNFEQQTYDSGDEMLEYTTEDTTQYRKQPGRRRRENYYRAETELEDDSDSDCRTCTSRRRQRSDYMSEYPSEYQREDMATPRNRNTHRQGLRRRNVLPSETEIERSPYRRNMKNRADNRRSYHEEYEEEFDYHDTPYGNYFEGNDRENPYRRIQQEVYVARAPDGHKVFAQKQQHQVKEQTSGSGSEMDLEDDEEGQDEKTDESGWRQNQSRYQVFAANTGESQAVFQKQLSKSPRETLISVTNYDKSSVPMVALRNTSPTKHQDENQSIVYLPVVVMDNTIKLPRSKVVDAESILKNIGNKAEKPLETNMNIYLATENGQGNIFQQAQRNGLQEKTTSKNTEVFTVQSTHSFPVAKKPSAVSKIGSPTKLKSKSKSGDYPVQKSYIKVVNSRTNPVEQKGSKISIKSVPSKTSHSSSLIGEDKPNSPRGSAYYAKAHKKEIKDKKDRKNKRKIKQGDSDSELVSVINPTSIDKQSNEPRRNTIISTKGDMQKQTSMQRSTSQNTKKKPDIDNKSALTKNSTKQLSFDRHVSVLKQPTLDENGTSKVTLKRVPSKQSNLERQCSTEKDSKIITIKDVSNGKYEESKNIFIPSETDLQSQTDHSEGPSSIKKGFGNFFHKKDSKTQSDHTTPKNDPYTFNPDEYTSPTSSLAAVRREKSKEDVRKQKKSPSGRKLQRKRSNVEFSNRTEEFQIWKVLSFDSYAFKYIYQVVQYFLGLSIHGTLMEILRNSK